MEWLLIYQTGIAYQLTPADPLVDTEQCQRDASLMKTLGANAIRIYHVEPNENHSGCMSAFEEAGIYTLIDLDTFTTDIDPVRYLRYDTMVGLFADPEIERSILEPDTIRCLRRGNGCLR